MIEKLNELIVMISKDNIEKHLDDLEDWCDEWRIAASVCSVSLFTTIKVLEDRVNERTQD